MDILEHIWINLINFVSNKPEFVDLIIKFTMQYKIQPNATIREIITKMIVI